MLNNQKKVSKYITSKPILSKNLEFVPNFCLIKSQSSLLAPILSLFDVYLAVINLISGSVNIFQKVSLPNTAYLTLFDFKSHSFNSGFGINPKFAPDKIPKLLV